MSRKEILAFTILQYKGIGAPGQILKLRRGFFNFLLKKGVVVYYEGQEEIKSKEIEEREKIILPEISLVFYRHANNLGNLYEKVTRNDILSSLYEKGIHLNSEDLNLIPMKKLGFYKINIENQDNSSILNIEIKESKGDQ